MREPVLNIQSARLVPPQRDLAAIQRNLAKIHFPLFQVEAAAAETQFIQLDCRFLGAQTRQGQAFQTETEFIEQQGKPFVGIGGAIGQSQRGNPLGRCNCQLLLEIGPIARKHDLLDRQLARRLDGFQADIALPADACSRLQRGGEGVCPLVIGQGGNVVQGQIERVQRCFKVDLAIGDIEPALFKGDATDEQTRQRLVLLFLLALQRLDQRRPVQVAVGKQNQLHVRCGEADVIEGISPLEQTAGVEIDEKLAKGQQRLAIGLGQFQPLDRERQGQGIETRGFDLQFVLALVGNEFGRCPFDQRFEAEPGKQKIGRDQAGGDLCRCFQQQGADQGEQPSKHGLSPESRARFRASRQKTNTPPAPLRQSRPDRQSVHRRQHAARV